MRLQRLAHGHEGEATRAELRIQGLIQPVLPYKHPNQYMLDDGELLPCRELLPCSSFLILGAVHKDIMP